MAVSYTQGEPPNETEDSFMGSARMDKGPAEVLRILREGGTDEEIQEALLFSRESFRAKWGCYPEELTAVTVDVEVDPDSGEG